jgi:hypothetical protein
MLHRVMPRGYSALSLPLDSLVAQLASSLRSNVRAKSI